MRKLLSITGAGLLMGASQAIAGFQFSYTIEQGAGDLADKNIFKFYAQNDQLGKQANTHSLFGFEIWMKVLGSGATHKIDQRDLDGDGILDANIHGVGIDKNNPTASFLNLGELDHPTGDIGLGGEQPDGLSSFTISLPRYHYSSRSPNNVALYTNPVEFHTVAINMNRLDATQGRGFQYGVAVVPLGHDVQVRGQVASENAEIVDTGAPLAAPSDDLLTMAFSDAYTAYADHAAASRGPLGAPPPQPGEYIPFNFVAQAPEPAALSLLGLGMIALRRTRRTAR